MYYYFYKKYKLKLKLKKKFVEERSTLVLGESLLDPRKSNLSMQNLRDTISSERDFQQKVVYHFYFVHSNLCAAIRSERDFNKEHDRNTVWFGNTIKTPFGLGTR